MCWLPHNSLKLVSFLLPAMSTLITRNHFRGGLNILIVWSVFWLFSLQVSASALCESSIKRDKVSILYSKLSNFLWITLFVFLKNWIVNIVMAWCKIMSYYRLFIIFPVFRFRWCIMVIYWACNFVMYIRFKLVPTLIKMLEFLSYLRKIALEYLYL